MVDGASLVRLHRFSWNGGDSGGAVVGGMRHFTALALRGYFQNDSARRARVSTILIFVTTRVRKGDCYVTQII